jgi:Domain of unknown function (DUF4476)
MKKIAILFTLSLVLIRIAAAQTSNAILFTENGEKFTAILNGVKQNEKPETNVKITGLNAEFYKLKVIFENTALGEKNMNLYIHLGTETSYSIRKNNKGEYVLRLVSEVPVAQAPASTPMQTVVVYHAAPQAPATGTQTIQTTTTTISEGNPDNISLNMGINVNDAGGSVSIQASGMDMEEETTTVTHTTTTTTTTTTNANIAPASQVVAYLPGYTGPIGCPMPMASNEFHDLRSSISSKTFEDTRMTIAKQVLSDRCILASQVKEVMLLFTFEDNRLDFAKFAYDKTYDIGNYFKVNDAFTFETSIEELNQYIDSRR